MAVIQGMALEEIMREYERHAFVFDQLTEDEICYLLAKALDADELCDSPVLQALADDCLNALTRFPEYAKPSSPQLTVSEKPAADLSVRRIRRRRRYLTAIAVAAIIASCLTSTVCLAVPDLPRWTFRRVEDKIIIEIANDIPSFREYPPDEFIRYDSLDVFLRENPDFFLPYIPDGLYPLDMEANLVSGSPFYAVSFCSPDYSQALIISQETLNSTNMGYRAYLEINNEYSEEYVVSGITLYIESNNRNSFQMFWFVDNTQYHISGNLPLDVMKKIIDSYYEGETE